MARYLVDTSTIIDYTRGFEPVRSRLRALINAGEELAVTAIQIGEFMSGSRPADRPDWNGFLASFNHWAIAPADANGAGIYRYDFARQGVQLAMTDALTAAVARSRAAVLITENVKHFPMTDIRVLSLRMQAANGP